MIAKLGKGAGFGGCAKYDLDQGHKNHKEARLLDHNGVPVRIDKNGNISVNAYDIGRAFRAQAMALNPGIKQPVGRAMLAFDPKDTPRLTDEYMVKLAREYMERMGIVNTQYTIVRHSEKDHQHVHIIYNRVDNEGKLISDSNNFKRSVAICKDITRREGLTLGKDKTISMSIPNDPAERLRYETARIVGHCVKRVESLEELSRMTKRYGVTTHVKTNPNSKVPNGISFSTKDGDGNVHHFKGSQLDRNLSIGNIMKTIYGEAYSAKAASGIAARGAEKAEAHSTGEERSQRSEHSSRAEIASSVVGLLGGESSRRHEDEEIGQKKGRGMHM